LSEANEVVIVDTGDDDFVILKVVQERIQLLLQCKEVVVRGLADDWWMITGGCCEEQRSGCCVC